MVNILTIYCDDLKALVEGSENHAGPIVANLKVLHNGSYSCHICQNLPLRSLLFSLFCLSDSHSSPIDTRENVVCCLFVDGTSAWFSGVIKDVKEKGDLNGTV